MTRQVLVRSNLHSGSVNFAEDSLSNDTMRLYYAVHNPAPSQSSSVLLNDRLLLFGPH